MMGTTQGSADKSTFAEGNLKIERYGYIINVEFLTFHSIKFSMLFVAPVNLI